MILQGLLSAFIITQGYSAGAAVAAPLPTAVAPPHHTEWSLWLRDDTLYQVGMIGSFESFEMVLNHNDAGTWKLVCPRDSLAGQTLATDPHQALGIILKRDGEPLAAGFVTRIENQETPTANVCTVYGSDDTALLGSRVVVPDPWWSETAIPMFVQSHDVRSGSADQVMAEYVDVSMGPATVTMGAVLSVGFSASVQHGERQLYGLVIPRTGGFGGTITYQARFINLMQVCQDIAVMGGGLRFKIINGDFGNPGFRSFVVDVPEDRTEQIVFATDLGTLTGVDRSESIPTTNYAWAGGQGEMVQRTLLAAADLQSIANYGRWELFIDQRQTADGQVLLGALLKALEDGSEELSFQINPSDTMRDSFGADWNVGDRVSVLVSGVRIPGYISQVHFTINRVGLVRVLPTVTTSLLSKATRSAVAVLNRRLSYLETSDGSWTPGTVIMWDRAIGDAPAGWAICDGTLGTRDFTGRSPIGVGAVPGGGPTLALGATSGAGLQATHVHAGPSHTHAGPSHTHTVGPTNVSGESDTGNVAGGHGAQKETHTHTIPDTGASGTANTSASGTANTAAGGGDSILHPVMALYFLKRVTI